MHNQTKFLVILVLNFFINVFKFLFFRFLKDFRVKNIIDMYYIPCVQ